MGLVDWILWRPSQPNAASSSVDAQSGHVTSQASVEKGTECHTTRKKLILYAYLGVIALVWHDLLLAGFGLTGQIFALLLSLYGAILCYPGQIGKWDKQERLQLRSIIIVKASVATAILGLPFWICLIADDKYLSWIPIISQVGLLRTAFALYVTWYLTFDKKAGRTGSRYFETLRDRRFWAHMANYFPIKLTRTVALDPDRHYIFGYHPHGLVSVGAITNFSTNATGFKDLFPGIELRLCTLAINFKIPFVREYFLGMGFQDVSKEALQYNLTYEGAAASSKDTKKGEKPAEKKKGESKSAPEKKRSVMLVIGGAKESLEADVGANTLILKERKGFVKMALRTGASLVPVYSFGENDIYEVVGFTGRWKKYQMALQKRLGFAIPIFFGRALSGGPGQQWLWNKIGWKGGLFPFRTPIHSVVGSPILIDRKYTDAEIEADNNKLLNQYHGLYIEELKKVYGDWNAKCLQEREERIQELDKDPDRKEILKNFEDVKKLARAELQIA